MGTPDRTPIDWLGQFGQATVLFETPLVKPKDDLLAQRDDIHGIDDLPQAARPHATPRRPEAHRDPAMLHSQLSFLSEAPQAALEDLSAWLETRGITALVGRYSGKEFFLDASAAFVDFVIEAMTPDLADDDAAV